MKKIWKSLFAKKKTYSQDGEFKLCIINDNTDSLHETLGLTDERAKELSEICLNAWNKHNKTTSMLQEMLGHCKHMNEVTMIFFIFHKIVELKRNETRSGMEGMLREIFGR
jgi:hypothetical protein